VEAVRKVVSELVADGETSVGVITPFRHHAEQLEEMLARSFTDQEIDQVRLRVGTVHGFQGGERDVVVASLGLAADDPPGRRRFVEEPNLFNVLVTRARRRMVVVTSLDLDADGLIGAYLRYGEHGLPPVAARDPEDPWAAELAVELRRAGITARGAYPVGPWSLDLVAGPERGAVAVECRVDPAGAATHIDRHLTLRGLGWEVVDGFPSRWDDDAVRAALELTDRLRDGGGA
jgi:hypothetical protein